MRKHFAAYYRPSPAEFATLKADAVVSLDANVLLNFYRYSDETRDQFAQILERLKSRLWLTHQAAKEFQANRALVIAEQRQVLVETLKALKEARDQLGAKVKDIYRSSPSDEVSKRWASVEGALDSLTTHIEDCEKKAILPTADLDDDPIWRLMTDLFDGRVGDPYEPDDLQRHLEAGKTRYAKLTPPGHADATKTGDKPYGDWLVWRQLLDHAVAEARPVLLVTDDRKEDWWLRVKSRTIGPRPELIDEMAHEAGQAFYLYRPEQFLTVFEASGEAIKEAAALQPIDDAPGWISMPAQVDVLGPVVAARRLELGPAWGTLDSAFLSSLKSLQDLNLSPSYLSAMNAMSSLDLSSSYASAMKAMSSLDLSSSYASAMKAMSSLDLSRQFASTLNALDAAGNLNPDQSQALMPKSLADPDHGLDSLESARDVVGSDDERGDSADDDGDQATS
jgi:hypothetical protein